MTEPNAAEATQTPLEGSPATGGEGAAPSAGVPTPAAAPSTPATELLPPGANNAGGVVAAPVEPNATPGKAVGSDAPPLAELQNQLCPNCHTGVLYVVRYDPNALFEAGQSIPNYVTAPALPAGFESGGGYEVHCFHCEYNHSFPFNPGESHGQAR